MDKMCSPGALVGSLLVVGGDHVHKALANVAGTELAQFNVPFSFGWLAYAISALGPVFAGERNVLPKPEQECFVMNMESGESCKNQSFLLARLLRDLEKKAGPDTGGLQITVLESTGKFPNNDSPKKVNEVSFQDLAHQVGAIATMLQLSIALFSSGSVLLITNAATFMAIATYKLNVWKASRSTGPRNANETYAIMHGKGHRHLFLIKNTGADALNIGDLAALSTKQYNWFGRGGGFEGFVVIVQVLLWLLLAIWASNLDEGVGSLLVIMTIGTIANSFTAYAPRSPDAHGIPLVQKSTHSGDDVMTVLKQLEDQEPGKGQNLFKIYFPDPLSEDQAQWWAEKKEASDKKKAELKLAKQLAEEAAKKVAIKEAASKEAASKEPAVKEAAVKKEE